MPMATIEGLPVNYQVQGTGPHLLLLAPGGFDSTIARWSSTGVWKEMDALTALARHFTVIAYDRREAGASGGRVEPLAWDVFARQGKALLDHLQVRDAYLLGGCMGVSVALAMAANYPEICRGLMLHWPVGGYRWMLKGRGFFDRHIAFVREHGLAAAAARAPAGKNFWHDPEAGPWASPIVSSPAFAADYARQDVGQYLETVAAGRDALYGDTMPSGATGEALTRIHVPSIILPGADASHATSAAWALKELMPNADLWDVLPPHQNGENVLARLLAFSAAVERAARAA